MQRLTRLLSQNEAYSPEDLPTALRIGSTLWAMGMAIAILLLPLSPPDEAIGGAGWIVTAGARRGRGRRLVRLPLPRVPWTFNRLYVSSFVAVVAIGVMQWLAGGNGAPYCDMLL